MDFTEDQIQRYARHIVLPEVGGIGQEKLLNARVLVIGAGGLGAPLLMYLAAAGVGTLGVVDDDSVDLSNLQRQVIHGTGDIGMAKVESAGRTVAEHQSGNLVCAASGPPYRRECRQPDRLIRPCRRWQRQFRNPLPGQ